MGLELGSELGLGLGLGLGLANRVQRGEAREDLVDEDDRSVLAWMG